MCAFFSAVNQLSELAACRPILQGLLAMVPLSHILQHYARKTYFFVIDFFPAELTSEQAKILYLAFVQSCHTHKPFLQNCDFMSLMVFTNFS